MQQKKEKKGPSVLLIIFIILFGFVMLAEGETGEILATVIGLVVMFLPFYIVFRVIRAVVKSQKTDSRPGVHSHDRIDHSRDLQVNRRTGKVERVPVRYEAHSAQEHWKQQLDGLLANGTIDRAEYRAMMKRKF